MTLFRQIFVMVSILCLLLLGALETSYVRHTREFLQQQLTSHAQDVATSLGMVLPLSMKDNDTVRTEATVDAVFERGYYRSIRVLSVGDQTLLLRQLPAAPPSVPAWFVRLVPLQAPSAESLVSSGWRQLGRVVVTSLPNFAYQQLWDTTRSATELLALFYAASLLLLWAFLRTVLRPLRAIEAVAQDIGERRFTTVDERPRARELRRVVAAINTLSGKIRDAIGIEIAAAQRYRLEAYRDPLTGFDNRRSFTHQLENSLYAHGGESAALFLVQVEGLEALNTAQGFAFGDALLTRIAAALGELQVAGECVRARLGGATFALLCWKLDADAAAELGARIDRVVTGAIASAAGITHGVGAVYVPQATDRVSALLGEADAGVRQALAQTGAQHMVMLRHDPSALDVQGGGSWKSFMHDALAQGRVALWVQPVLSLELPAPGAAPAVLQQELTASLLDTEGEPVSAARFIPMALRFGIMPALDGAFLAAMFKHLDHAREPLASGQIAINLAVQSIHDTELVATLLDNLTRRPELARRLVFEFSEFGLAQDIARLGVIVARLRGLGANFAVDNFGFHASAFQYLQQLRPAYIKLASSYLQDLEQHAENQFFIASVVRVARPLDILTLACGVESAERLELLRSLGVGGYQGWAGARPQRID
jgi:diguanylate cyclase (GGDEF)-like protein